MDKAPGLRGSWRSLLLVVALVWGSSQAWSWWRDTQSERAVQMRAQQGDIVMFTTDDCPYCARARTWLKARAVPWRECNIEHHEGCRRIFEAQGAPGVPLMYVRGQWHLGFEPTWLAGALERAPRAAPVPGH